MFQQDLGNSSLHDVRIMRRLGPVREQHILEIAGRTCMSSATASHNQAKALGRRDVPCLRMAARSAKRTVTVNSYVQSACQPAECCCTRLASVLGKEAHIPCHCELRRNRIRMCQVDIDGTLKLQSSRVFLRSTCPMIDCEPNLPNLMMYQHTV